MNGLSKDAFQLKKCHRCGSNSIVVDLSQGEICCKACGLVITQKFESTNPEWRNFEDSADRKRTGDGFSLSIGDYGLSTMIDTSYKDSKGLPLSKNSREIVRRIRIQDIRSKSAYSSINSKTILSFLDGICDKLGLTYSIKEEAAYIYRKAIERRLTLGRSSNSMMAAAIYIASRKNGILRTLQDVSAASDVRMKRLSQSYKSLVIGLGLSMPVLNHYQYISKIANDLNLSEQTKRVAIDIFNNAQKLKITEGRDPASLAAAMIYLACEIKGKRCSQKKISDASGISPVTIRTRYKEIRKKLDLNELPTI